MGTGKALVVGCSKPHPNSGWSASHLPGVMNDVRSMSDLFGRLGFQVQPLTEQAATAGATLSAIRSAAGQLASGDLFVFSYSGHGGQKASQDADEALDQYFLTYDRAIADDELGRLWPEFKPGVRIVVLTDSCHSGSSVRALRDDSSGGRQRETIVEAAASDAPRLMSIGLTESAGGEARTRDGNIEGLRASLLHLAAALDPQKAIDLGSHGAFTDALLKAWNAGHRASYDQLFSAIKSRIRHLQTPRMTLYGWDQALFREQKPFDISAPWPL